jgi:iron(III) transport system substrate-binding protein
VNVQATRTSQPGPSTTDRSGRPRASWVALCLVVVLAAACADDDGAGDADGAADEATDTGANADDAGDGQLEDELVWYAATPERASSRVAAAFEEETGVRVNVLHAGSGDLVARVIAEAGSPAGDIFTAASENHELLRAEGLLRSYDSPVHDEIDPAYWDPDGYWHGQSVSSIALGVNMDRWEESFGDAPLPETWDDVLGPELANELVMPNPSTSGTGYNFLATQFFRLGDEEAWDYFDALNESVGEYSSSGGSARLLGAGEYTLGINFSHDLVNVQQAGFPIEIVHPDPTGFEVGASGIITDGPNPNAAERFIDFIMGHEAQQLLSDLQGSNPIRDGVALPDGATALDEINLLEFDAVAAAEMRSDVLDEYLERYQP